MEHLFVMFGDFQKSLLLKIKISSFTERVGWCADPILPRGGFVYRHASYKGRTQSNYPRTHTHRLKCLLFASRWIAWKPSPRVNLWKRGKNTSYFFLVHESKNTKKSNFLLNNPPCLPSLSSRKKTRFTFPFLFEN